MIRFMEPRRGAFYSQLVKSEQRTWNVLGELRSEETTMFCTTILFTLTIGLVLSIYIFSVESSPLKSQQSTIKNLIETKVDVTANNRKLSPNATFYAYRPTVDSICYGVLGCFNNTGPFNDFIHRPFQPLPDSPSEIGTRFYLYTRRHKDTAKELWSWNYTHILNTDFDSKKKTKVIIHGYLNDKESPWVKQMSDKLLRIGDFNVIVVDWIFGAVDLYQQSAVNTRVVGAELWYLMTMLRDLKGLKYEDVHLIGHSLGAHVAGYAGELMPGLARISGLDPAQPYFENTDPVCRLDHTDATFVDVIHTDTKSFVKSVATGGYGIKQPCGHVDFYPNGGVKQPHCQPKDSMDATVSVGILEGLRYYVTCNHMRAIYLYLESLDQEKTCDFTTFPCENYEDFLAGKCLFCGRRCAKMGYFADKVDINHMDEHSNKFYVATGGFPNYCRQNYFLKMEMGSETVTGQMFAEIDSSTGSTRFRELTDGPTDFETSHTFLFLSNVTAVEPSTLKLTWLPTSTWLGMGILGRTGREQLDLGRVSVIGSRMMAKIFEHQVVQPESTITGSFQFLTNE